VATGGSKKAFALAASAIARYYIYWIRSANFPPTRAALLVSPISMTPAAVPASAPTTGDGASSRAAWFAVAVSLATVMPVEYTGAAGNAAFIAIWAIFAFAFLKSSLKALKAHWSIWVFPGFAVLSTLWSYTMTDTLRHAVELVATVGVAAIAARHLSPRRLVTALSCTCFAVSLLCIVVGRYILIPPQFVGVFGSKNQLAFFVNLVMIANIALLIDGSRSLLVRAWSVGCILVGAGVFTVMDRTSATANVMTAIGPVILLANYWMSHLKPSTRRAIIGVVIVIGTPVLIVGGGAFTDTVLEALGKNYTLTGRTEMWGQGLQVFDRAPMLEQLLGQGYEAFWRENYVEAESIWTDFNYGIPAGFHFHNTYVENLVGLGVVGCAIVIYFMIATLVRAVRWSWDDRTIVSSFFVTTMVNLFVHSFVEVEVTFQFYHGAILFYVIMYYSLEHARSRRLAMDAAKLTAKSGPGAYKSPISASPSRAS